MTEPRWLEMAREYIGTAEIAGSKHNKDIVEMHRAVSGVPHSDEVAWCSSFAGFILKKAGIKNSGSLMARSYSKWGDPVSHGTVGSIVVLSSPGRGPSAGHVGFCTGIDANYISLLGGNQGDKVSIARFPRSRIVASRWPKGEPKGQVRIGGGGEVEPSDA